LAYRGGLSVVGAIVGDFFFVRVSQDRPLIDDTARLQSEQLFASVALSSLLGLVMFWGLAAGAFAGRLVARVSPLGRMSLQLLANFPKGFRMHRSRWLNSTLPVLAVAVMAAGCTSAAAATPTTAPAAPTDSCRGCFAGGCRGGLASGFGCPGPEAGCLAIRGGSSLGRAFAERGRRRRPNCRARAGESQGRVSRHRRHADQLVART
jgi:hypothetical protein